MNYVISLGGSLINDGKINTVRLRRLVRVISGFAAQGNRFFVICGGGRLAREYIAAARAATQTKKSDQDWLGVAATRINAELVRVVFGNPAYRRVITDPSKKIKTSKRVLIFSGWKPGWSTDYVSVRVAKTYGIETVVNLSNIDYVYDADPRRNRHARRFEKMSWRQFRKQFGTRWQPGSHLPFDPVGAKLAQHLGIKVVVMNGNKEKNLAGFLAGKVFRGTIVQ